MSNEFRAIVDLLEEEANQLALFMHRPEYDTFPHRVRQAIDREIKRVRALASNLNKVIPPEPNPEA